MSIETIKQKLIYIQGKIDAIKEKGEIWTFNKGLYYNKDENLYEYKMNDCLSEHQIQEIESKYNIQLPYAYRMFLLNIGNGMKESYERIMSLEEAIEYTLSFVKHDITVLSRPFPFTETFDLMAQFREHFGFYLYSPEGDVYYKDHKEEVETFFEQFRVPYYIQGTLILYYPGGSFYRIIITGEEKGNIWCDEIFETIGIIPELNPRDKSSHIDFLTWFELKVDDVLADLTEQAEKILGYTGK